MHETEYILHWEAFCKKFAIDTSSTAREIKFFDEVRELDEALFGFIGDPDDEILDCIITLFALARARGRVNILDACYMKLQRTERKYIEAGTFDNPSAGQKKGGIANEFP